MDFYIFRGLFLKRTPITVYIIGLNALSICILVNLGVRPCSRMVHCTPPLKSGGVCFPGADPLDGREVPR